MSNTPERWTPKRGDEVYDEHGQAGYYIDRAKGGGHIVQAIVESDGDGFSEPGGAYVGDPVRWSEVFRAPPQPKLDAKIAEQEKRLEAIREEIREAESKKRELEVEQRAMKERLALHEQLTWIDDLLAGRFTHYLVKESDYGESWIVMTADDFRKNRNCSQVRLQLFASIHDRTTSFQWRVIQGSPGDRFDDKSRGVIPFKSEAEAVARRNEFLLESIEKAVAAHANAGSHHLRGLVAKAAVAGVEVPDHAAHNLRQRELVEANAEFDKVKAAYSAAAARLEQLSRGGE